MALNDDILSFAGSPTEVIASGTSADVLNDEVIGGQVELDYISNLHWFGLATIGIPSSFSAAPTGPIVLYMVQGDTDGTSNDTALGYAALTTTDDQTNPEYARYMGQWNPTIDEAYRDTIPIDLTGVKQAKFYVQNKTNVTFTTTAAVIVDIETFSHRPDPSA